MASGAGEEALSLRERLRRAEAILDALQGDEVDAIVGRGHVALLRLREVEERLRQANEELEATVQSRTEELRRRAGQLQALALELTHSEESERRRLAMVLHDGLQQLLAAMQCHLGILARSSDEDELRNAVASLSEITAEAQRTTRTLTADLSPGVLYQQGLPAALEWLGERVAERHRVRVEVVAEPAADPGDERLRVFLFQAARELVFNAVKHAHADRVTVELSSGGGEIELSVSDRGRGFDVAGAARSGRLAGYGLFSIEERAALLGGRLGVESRPGAGTRVTLAAPSAVAAAAPAAAREGAAAAPARDGLPAADGAEIAVLLVDDHAMMRQGLAALLHAERGIAVVGEASNGADAVELALRLRPDVIVMDVKMPGLDGVEATRRIRRSAPEVRVIGLSMYDDAGSAAAMLAAGAECYLAKARATDDLINAVRGAAPAEPC